MTDPSAERVRVRRLRRPPQVVRVEGPFVPDVSLTEVDRLWAKLVESNPRYFDGPILHVLGTSRNGHGGVTIHVVETSYRYYAVQRPRHPGQRDWTGRLDCGVRPLGAKGICRLRARAGGDAGEGGSDDRFLMAKRSGSVAFYPNEWEFAPGGGLEPSDDPARCVLRELAEETDVEAISPPIAIALLYDPSALSWEVVHTLDVAPSTAADASHAWEHAERTFVARGAWPEPLCQVARAMLDLIPPPSQRR